MSIFNWLIDGILALALFWIAWQSLTVPNLFRAVKFFVVFGLLMAVAWMRLSALDVALVEITIGAGLTGILFWDALPDLGEDKASG
ncbi:MAG: sodium:proton antiporter [Candidatus Parabeggiatoa sp. nov. 3]|nr:MAG: sodium:proton antiporter [Gammaproteobacteria bacterium]